MSAIDFQGKLRDLVGSKYAETMALIQQFGIEVLTKTSEFEAKIGSLKITSFEQPQQVVIRRFQFVCEINGQPMVEIKRIELDPIDYDDGEIFTAKITVMPMFTGKIEETTDEGLRTN